MVEGGQVEIGLVAQASADKQDDASVVGGVIEDGGKEAVFLVLDLDAATRGPGDVPPKRPIANL